VLHKESLFLLCDHAPAAYLLALDRRTGKEVWKVDRGKDLRSYSTPFLVAVGIGSN
jgi:glucose dehydrogenase